MGCGAGRHGQSVSMPHSPGWAITKGGSTLSS
jgi:hypothetical protein